VINLLTTQRQFAGSKARYPAFVGGFGSGKTHAAIMRAISLKSQIKEDVAYYLPTYDLVSKVAFPRFTEILSDLGIAYKLNKNDNIISTPDYGGVIHFRTMDNPEKIIGYEVAHSILDELDTLPTEKARNVWNKVIARNRKTSPLGNSVAVATTPEGFRFTYELWVKNKPSDEYVIYKAKTKDNPHLPDGYIQSLESTYSSSLLQAYLEGEFVNLTAGCVYHLFDRKLNAAYETIKDKEPLHIGVDFNVTNMSAAIHVIRDGNPIAVMEYTGIFDTPALGKMLKERYKDIGHSIFIYPDASGNSRKSNNASETDISILRQFGFNVLYNSTNPAVKDRVLSFNKMIEERKYKINPDTCPSLCEALERQSYDKNGEPDKTSGFDHINDAAGYFVTYKYPINGRTQLTKIAGI